MKRPDAADFLDAAVRYPEYTGFMDHTFSCLGYDRSTAPAGFVLSGADRTIGDVFTEMAHFKRREPRDGMHSSRAISFLLDVAKMAGVEFVRFLSVGNCNGTLPSFAVDTWAPFTTLRGSSVQVEGLRDIDDYAPGMLDLAAASYAASAQPGMPTPPKKPKVAAGVCALPGCFLPVYGAGVIIALRPIQFRRAPSPRFRPRLLSSLRGLLRPGPLRRCLWLRLSSRRRSSLASAASSVAVLRLLLRSSLPHRLRPPRRPLPPSSAHLRSPSLTLMEALPSAAAARAAARATKAKDVVAAKVVAVKSPAALAKLPCRSAAGLCR